MIGEKTQVTGQPMVHSSDSRNVNGIQRVAMAVMMMVLAVGGLAMSAHAADRGFTNYDGDTFRATFRIANIDTPEIKGECDAERELAQRAKVFTERFLAQGNIVIIQSGIDRYGRVLAVVSREGHDLGEALIAEGLARPWKGKREQWCK